MNIDRFQIKTAEEIREISQSALSYANEQDFQQFWDDVVAAIYEASEKGLFHIELIREQSIHKSFATIIVDNLKNAGYNVTIFYRANKDAHGRMGMSGHQDNLVNGIRVDWGSQLDTDR